MIIDYPKERDIPAMRQLWKQAFGDTDAFLDGFFSTAFAPERSLCVFIEGVPVAMLYWFDCQWEERKIAYVYAVATEEAHQKQGICHKLMESLKRRLQRRGYFGILLVPENPKLVPFYRKMGYEIACTCEHFDVPAAGNPDPGLRQITWQKYKQLRPQLLPEGSVELGEEAYRYMDTFLKFYIADAGLFCCRVEEDLLVIQEFLGEPKGLFAITTAMGCRKAKVRLRGSAPFGLLRRLTKDKSMPKYFGLPMD